LNRTADLCVDIRVRRDVEEVCERLALDGLRLCHGHRRELERLIAELPAIHDDLDRPAGPPSASAGGGAAGLNVDEAAADLRGQIHHDLLWWCRYVADCRGFHRPASETPTSAAAWLTLQVDWLAADQHASRELLPVLRELTGRAYGLTDIPARYLDLGDQCLIHTEGERCEGVVTLVVRGDEWTAVCPACRERAKLTGARYEAQDATPYLRVARRGKWIPAADVIRLAEVFGITASEDVVRQWKHRRRIVGRVGPIENMYDLGSVQRYLAQRQAETRRISA